jgi:hypothetical protein
MRRLSRNLTGTLILTLMALVFGPLLLCGSGPMSKAEASACCRAMHFQCHRDGRTSACCEHQEFAPLHVTLSTAQDSVAMHPQIAGTVLGSVPTLNVPQPRSAWDLFPVSSHSPPKLVPLFLRNSSLRI